MCNSIQLRRNCGHDPPRFRPIQPIPREAEQCTPSPERVTLADSLAAERRCCKCATRSGMSETAPSGWISLVRVVILSTSAHRHGWLSGGSGCTVRAARCHSVGSGKWDSRFRANSGSADRGASLVLTGSKNIVGDAGAEGYRETVPLRFCVQRRSATAAHA